MQVLLDFHDGYSWRLYIAFEVPDLCYFCTTSRTQLSIFLARVCELCTLIFIKFCNMVKLGDPQNNDDDSFRINFGVLNKFSFFCNMSIVFFVVNCFFV